MSEPVEGTSAGDCHDRGIQLLRIWRRRQDGGATIQPSTAFQTFSVCHPVDPARRCADGVLCGCDRSGSAEQPPAKQARSLADQRALCQQLAQQFIQTPSTASIRQLSTIHEVPDRTLRDYIKREKAALGDDRTARAATPITERPYLHRKGGQSPRMTEANTETLISRIVAAALSGEWMAMAQIVDASASLTIDGKPLSPRTAHRLKRIAEQRHGVRFKMVTPTITTLSKAKVDPAMLSDFIRRFHRQILHPIEPLQVDTNHSIDLQSCQNFVPIRDVWNIDETLIEINPNAKPSKAWALEHQRVVHIYHPTLRCTISMVSAISHDGATVPPYFIVEASDEGTAAKRVIPTIPKAIVESTSSGYSDSSVWPRVIEHICKHARRSDPSTPLILVIDNSDTHFSPMAGDVLVKHNAVFITLPVNSTHILQPLDARNGPHQIFKKHFRDAFTRYKKEAVSMEAALIELGVAFAKGYDPLVIMRSWRAAGLYANDDPEAFIKKHFTGEVEQAAAVIENGRLVSLNEEMRKQNEKVVNEAKKIVKGARMDRKVMRDEGRMGMSGEYLVTLGEKKQQQLHEKEERKQQRVKDVTQKRLEKANAAAYRQQHKDARQRILHDQPVRVRIGIEKGRTRIPHYHVMGLVASD